MGRLIDEDVLLARISLNYNNHQNISAGAMKDIINTTPTAYDAEKVVEELKGQIILNNNENVNLARTKAIMDCVKIVRKGGVE